ncbi:UNVERIFIED_CONTAM: hypothetical protein NCL1_26832 [Trichonephila clavipes]
MSKDRLVGSSNHIHKSMCTDIYLGLCRNLSHRGSRCSLNLLSLSRPSLVCCGRRGLQLRCRPRLMTEAPNLRVPLSLNEVKLLFAVTVEGTTGDII